MELDRQIKRALRGTLGGHPLANGALDHAIQVCGVMDKPHDKAFLISKVKSLADAVEDFVGHEGVPLSDYLHEDALSGWPATCRAAMLKAHAQCYKTSCQRL